MMTDLVLSPKVMFEGATPRLTPIFSKKEGLSYPLIETDNLL
jgi:hypothetical protein